MTDSVLSYQAILQQLARLHRDKRTGMARVATSDNQLLQVAFSDGEIVGFTLGLKHNLDAVKHFAAETRPGRLRFSETKPRVAEGVALPPTAGILRMLGLTDTLASLPVEASGEPTVQAVTTIEREVVEFLGPMASIIWDEQLALVGDLTRAGAIQKLIDGLAREISKTGDTKKAQHFRATITKKLAST